MSPGPGLECVDRRELGTPALRHFVHPDPEDLVDLLVLREDVVE